MSYYNPHFQHQYYPDYSSTYVVPNVQSWDWNSQVPLHQPPPAIQHQPPPPVRGNFVHVNPAFYHTHLPVVNSNKIIVNPKFFPNVQKVEPVPPKIEPLIVNPPPFAVKTSVIAKDVPFTYKPSSSRCINPAIISVAKGKPSKVGGNKYSWKKTDCSPVQSVFKLNRKSPLKSFRTPLKFKILKYNSTPLKLKNPRLKLINSPKITSTPIQSFPSSSRFKLDNRLKKKTKVATKSPRPQKIVHSKYRLVLKGSKVNISGSKVNLSRPLNRSLNRTFTNFKSPRTLVKNNLLHRFAAPKVKSVKKKTEKVKKSSKRYYDNKDNILEDSTPLAEDEVIEIGEKPSNLKSRKPIGLLPSFITL